MSHNESGKDCPMECGFMEPETCEKTIVFRGVKLCVPITRHTCPHCGITGSDVACTAAVQQEIADQFRGKTGLLTSRQIQTLREAKNMTQQDLAEKLEVDAAAVRRWEKANIQSRDMDQILRRILK